MSIDLNAITHKNIPAKESAGLSSLLNKEIQLFGSSMNDKSKERFFSELNVLLTAGVDIRTALELLKDEAIKPGEQKLYAAILSDVESGATLADAVEKTAKFSAYEYHSLRIGEESGNMNTVLKDLAEYFGQKIRQKRKVRSALSYPIVVMVVAFGAVGFMLRFVVPMFGEMLGRFHTELPAITKWIMQLSDAFAAYAPWVLLMIIALVALLMSQKKQLWYRRYSSAIILRLPFFGQLARKVYLERFCHSMHLLISSKTTLVTSLELVEKMIGFYPIEASLSAIRAEIFSGSTLHAAMTKHKVYHKRMISLIRVAEEVNQLDTMFGKLSSQMRDEIEHETSLIGSVIEPLMIVLLGVMVAVILIAMYLPMFKLSSSFG